MISMDQNYYSDFSDNTLEICLVSVPYGPCGYSVTFVPQGHHDIMNDVQTIRSASIYIGVDSKLKTVQSIQRHVFVSKIFLRF